MTREGLSQSNMSVKSGFAAGTSFLCPDAYDWSRLVSLGVKRKPAVSREDRASRSRLRSSGLGDADDADDADDTEAEDADDTDADDVEDMEDTEDMEDVEDIESWVGYS